MKKIEFELNSYSINRAIKQIRKLDAEWDRKIDTLLQRLASIGATKASLDFSRAVYTGDNDVSVSVEPIENGYSIIASGEAVLFIEFGSPTVTVIRLQWSTDPAHIPVKGTGMTQKAGISRKRRAVPIPTVIRRLRRCTTQQRISGRRF